MWMHLTKIASRLRSLVSPQPKPNLLYLQLRLVQNDSCYNLYKNIHCSNLAMFIFWLSLWKSVTWKLKIGFGAQNGSIVFFTHTDLKHAVSIFNMYCFWHDLYVSADLWPATRLISYKKTLDSVNSVQFLLLSPGGWHVRWSGVENMMLLKQPSESNTP